jgi:hypothetical protein
MQRGLINQILLPKPMYLFLCITSCTCADNSHVVEIKHLINKNLCVFWKM